MTAKSTPETQRDREPLERTLLREQQIAALSASIDGVAIFDTEQRFVYLNDAHAKIYGYASPDELLGRTWHVLYDNQELERFQKWIMPVFFEKGHWRGETVGTRKDGSSFPQEVSLSVVRGGGLVCVVRDITERRKMDEKRAIIHDITRSLGESVDYSDTIERISRIAVPRFADYCILNLRAVRRFKEQSRVTAAEPHDEAILNQLTNLEFCRDTESSCVVSRVEAPEPSSILARLGIMSYIFVPLRARGSTNGNLVFLRTVNHPHGPFSEMEHDSALAIGARAALAIENSRLFVEAREAVQLQEGMMTAVSHDLKNPLMAIGINVEILNRVSRGSPLEGPLKGISHNIKVSVDQMSCLVGQLLEYEKLRGGKVVLQKQGVRISEIFEKIGAIFSPVSESKSVRLEMRIDPPALSISCDGERIVRILSNLVGNSLKFTPSGGRVLVEATQGECEALFKVSDTGIGIRTEDLEHVFERHWQSKPATSQGTGLGLTIAKGLVEAHGGRIWAEGRPGAGSTFSFSIPIT